MRKLLSLFFAALCYTTIFATDYALPGKFTVNDKGDQVQFHNAFMRHITEHTYVTSCPSQMDLGITKLFTIFSLGERAITLIIGDLLTILSIGVITYVVT